MKRAPEFKRSRDAGILSRMHAGCHDERRPFADSIDEPHRETVRLALDQKFIYTIPLFPVWS